MFHVFSTRSTPCIFLLNGFGILVGSRWYPNLWSNEYLYYTEHHGTWCLVEQIWESDDQPGVFGVWGTIFGEFCSRWCDSPQEVGQCGSCVKTRHMAIRCPKVRDLPNPCLSHAGQCPVFGDTPMWCLFIPVVRNIVRFMFVHVAKFPRFVAEAWIQW